ncbi:EscU/YscU/HrcU family type III secretion system export apparatus switch protein [Frondihabitans australicus]|uniref:Flagellar biosynthetic protein FlhB n=1 Tax=Frondihabitans australicus TaxID=386892 RepID=A0A495IJF7_9MICO|nr:EscU/YscU/HrcU family type III secretion system export apparatus switch protein [Frondihabitans australicus]RKR75548.1 flagellar biosynthetic protein FlhB [Frondihabitans australicus]
MSDASGEKTEQATEKRMKEVRSKGQLSKSQDLGAWVGVAAAVFMMPATIARAKAAGLMQMVSVQDVIAHPTTTRATQALRDGLGSIGGILLPMLVVIAAAVLAVSVAQGGVHFKKSILKFEHFNPITGLKHMFGTQALWNGAKVLLKTAAVALVLWVVIKGLMPILMNSGLPLESLLAAASHGVSSITVAAVAAGLAMGGLDVMVVIRRNRKKTRMTKKEIKDEHKQSDGDPHIRQQRRQRAIAMSRNRMMAKVVDADVVMINPTEFAVALRYEPGRSAPRVIAKGKGEVARGIREKAEAEGIPMVKDIPLTRALHRLCELGDEIPVDLYTPVARVLTFVMALKARGSRDAQGTHSMPGGTIALDPEDALVDEQDSDEIVSDPAPTPDFAPTTSLIGALS